jgi:hypothetical protein
VPPVTVAAIQLDDIDVELEACVAQRRVIRAGRDAWDAIHKAETFDGWAAIGRALAVGREYALRVTGANAPMGRRYSVEFSRWVKQHGFPGMQKSVRSVALELHANIGAITAWRDSLLERQRKRLIHPVSATRRWRACTAHNGGKRPQDLKRDARAAWKRFVWCVRSLSAHEAAALWQVAFTEAGKYAA